MKNKKIKILLLSFVVTFFVYGCSLCEKIEEIEGNLKDQLKEQWDNLKDQALAKFEEEKEKYVGVYEDKKAEMQAMVTQGMEEAKALAAEKKDEIMAQGDDLVQKANNLKETDFEMPTTPYVPGAEAAIDSIPEVPTVTLPTDVENNKVFVTHTAEEAEELWEKAYNNNQKRNSDEYIPVVPGDGIDNDGDGLIDEELPDGLDNDGDGLIDEDLADQTKDHVVFLGGKGQENVVYLSGVSDDLVRIKAKISPSEGSTQTFCKLTVTILNKDAITDYTNVKVTYVTDEGYSLAPLNDEGFNGDLTAGDKTYTIQGRAGGRATVGVGFACNITVFTPNNGVATERILFYNTEGN